MKELVTHVPPTYTDVKECYDIISLCTEGLLCQATRRTSDRVMEVSSPVVDKGTALQVSEFTCVAPDTHSSYDPAVLDHVTTCLTMDTHQSIRRALLKTSDRT